MSLARVQAISGLVFGLFLLIHLATTVSALGGISEYDRILNLSRTGYRPHLVVELGLVGLAGVVHLGCAVAQMIRRKKVFQLGGPWWMKAHRASGWFLLLVAGGHALATRVAPLYGSGPADFSFLAYSLVGWPSFFRPYYLLLGCAGALHLGIGAYLALRLVARRWVPSALPSRFYLTAVVLGALLVMGGVGAMIASAAHSDTARFQEFQTLYQRFAPFLLSLRGQ